MPVSASEAERCRARARRARPTWLLQLGIGPAACPRGQATNGLRSLTGWGLHASNLHAVAQMPNSVRESGGAAGLVRVESVRVSDFRGLSDCTLALEPGLTLLVGRNSSGKSRLLRAIALACGAVSASSDDWTVGLSAEPTVDVVLAPGAIGPDESFDDRVRVAFGQRIQLTSVAGAERVAWRTVVRQSAEGWGGRTESRFLQFDARTAAWTLPTNAVALTREHRGVLAADLVDTGRDLAAELSQPGSAIRRVLSELDVPQAERAILEEDLQALGARIVGKSGTLAELRTRLMTLERTVGGIGTPQVNALPGRLEELVRMIEIALDTGSGGLPIRLHGSGARSLSSLQVQNVLYERRLGRDGSDLPTHPVTLLEGPEAHLHPQACFDVGALLHAVPGQVVASTHSSHLVTVVPTKSLRLVRCVDGKTILQDLSPVDGENTTPAALRLGVSAVEWEKLKRSVERPFGEVLFAHAIVVGDGASERGFLPHLLRHALGHSAAGVCVVNPEGMSQALPFVKYAEAAGIPCVLFCDCDDAGRKDAQKLPSYFDLKKVVGW